MHWQVKQVVASKISHSFGPVPIACPTIEEALAVGTRLQEKGPCEGAAVGNSCMDGSTVGSRVTNAVGTVVAEAVGSDVGQPVTVAVGVMGKLVVLYVGEQEGRHLKVGTEVGTREVGDAVILNVGVLVGRNLKVGTDVGATEVGDTVVLKG